LPFIIGVISDLSGDQANKIPYRERQFINIDRDNFNQVLRAIAPALTLRVNNLFQNKKDQKLMCNLSFDSIDSFGPEELARQIPECQALLGDRRGIIDLLSKIDSNEQLIKELTELIKSDKQVDRSKAISVLQNAGLTSQGEDEETKNRKVEMILAFDRHARSQKLLDMHGLLMSVVADIDRQLSQQLDEIIHEPAFQRLEARWRTLFDLVDKSETGDFLKIKLLNASSTEIYNDLTGSGEFDQSKLFKLIYEEEYGTMGGLPFSCLLLDEYFGKSNFDVRFLTLLSQVAAAAHAPMIVGTKPEMFDLTTFSDLQLPRDLHKIFDGSDSAEWNQFRETEEAKYINLCLPMILTRLPYGAEPSKSFNYNETVVGHSNQHFCWGNSAYSLAQKISDAVAKYGWAAAIRGVEGGGLVADLPAYTFKSAFADIVLKCPTQTHITDRREKELSDLGFIALCHNKMSNQAVFFSGQSAQKPKKYSSPEANTNAIISSRMPYMLNASRFVHYIKVIMREKIGSFQSAEQIENYLQDWIAGYVLLSEDADQATKAEYPLREAEILVEDILGKPGEYSIVMRLRPHYQMEAANVSVRFVGKVFAQE